MNRRDFMKHTVLTSAAAAVTARSARAGGVIPASDRVTLGVIGAGARAQQIIEAAQQVPGVEIVALCDAYRGRADAARRGPAARPPSRRMPASCSPAPDIDAVIRRHARPLHRRWP